MRRWSNAIVKPTARPRADSSLAAARVHEQPGGPGEEKERDDHQTSTFTILLMITIPVATDTADAASHAKPQPVNIGSM